VSTARRGLRYGLTANVVLLSIVSLLTDVSSEMIFPILPLFLTQVLLANALVVGLVEGLADGVAAFMKVLSGRWSDRSGRRKVFVAAGYGLSTGMKVLFPFARSWPEFLGTRAFERAGKGIRDAPRDALLADSVPQDSRGKAFGFHRSMDTTGAVLGPLITLYLLSPAVSLPLLVWIPPGDIYRPILLLAAIPAAIAVALTFLVKEFPRRPTPKVSLRLSFRGAPPVLLSFIAVASLFSFAEFSVAFLILLVGVAGEGATTAILLYVLFNVVYAAAAFPAGILSDRVGRKPVIVVGYTAFAGMATLLAFHVDLATLAIGFILLGLSFGMAEGTQRALVADLAPPEFRGTILGAFHTSVGLVKIASGIVAGLLWVTLTYRAMLVFALAVAMVAAIALAIWHPPVRFGRSGPGAAPRP